MKILMQFMTSLVLLFGLAISPVQAEFESADIIQKALEKSGPEVLTFHETWEILNDAYWYYNGRIQIAPMNYEDESDFQTQYEKAFRELSSKALVSSEIRLRLEPSSMKEMAERFRSNKVNFSEFVDSLSEQSSFYRKKGFYGTALIQLRFAALAQTIDKKLWENIMSWTGFFPFC